MTDEPTKIAGSVDASTLESFLEGDIGELDDLNEPFEKALAQMKQSGAKEMQITVTINNDLGAEDEVEDDNEEDQD